MKIEDEGRVNMEIESYLRTHTDVRRQVLTVDTILKRMLVETSTCALSVRVLQRLQKLVEHWMNKYDVDVEAKQKQLDVLIASKAKDLERLQDLTKTVCARALARSLLAALLGFV